MNALEKLEAVLCDPEGKCCIGGSDADRQIVDDSIESLRATLARPQEVAAVGEQMVAAGLRELEAIRQSDLCADTELIRRILEAASRVPVALPAEPVAGDVNAQTVIDRLNDTLNTIGNFAHDRSKGPAEQDDLWEVRRMAYEGQIEFDATTPVGAGGSGVMDARPDSVHSDSGECGRVQRVELSGDELALFQRTLDGFADCGETETGYETLVNWARRGLLECTNFRPTAAAHRMLATSTSTEQKGGAA